MPGYPQHLNPFIFEDLEELRSFDFFQGRVGPSLAKTLGWSCLDRLIFQLSHHDSALRSSALALSSLMERLHINCLLNTTSHLANIRHEIASSQYNKALNQLRRSIERPTCQNLGASLLTCLLLTIFEFLRGHDVAALIHLRSGLAILCQKFPRQLLASGSQSMSLSDHDKTPHVIMRVFAYLDVAATRWLGISPFLTEGNVLIDDFEISSLDLETFANFEEAEESLRRLTNQVHHFRNSVKTHSLGTISGQNQLPGSVQREKLRTQLDSWLSAMEILTEAKKGCLNAEYLRKVSHLRIKHRVSTIMIATSLESSMTVMSRTFDPIFEQIVSLSLSLVRPINVAINNNSYIPQCVIAPNGLIPLLQIGHSEGVIQALYLTAIYCGNDRISQKALCLLSSQHWREGAWESVAMARIAKRKMAELGREESVEFVRTHVRCGPFDRV